jgi:hypothetical protein
MHDSVLGQDDVDEQLRYVYIFDCCASPGYYACVLQLFCGSWYVINNCSFKPSKINFTVQ